MRKFLLSSAVLLVSALLANAQTDIDAEFFSLPENVTPEYLDSVEIKSVKPNDYWEIGVYGGASLQYGLFNPTRLVKWHLNYPVYGFSVIRHFTMFGIFPNMGMEFGMQQNYEGYEFKTNEETGSRSTESGAYKISMKVPEVFFLSHFHIDASEYFKLIVKAGLYGGYRTSIERTLDEAYEASAYTEFVNAFRDYDRRWTYGVQGGLGFGIMLDPIEIHFNVQVKWGWESFWEPDYASPYYYRYAYPLDGAVTFGLYYQLTPRRGHTRAQLRRMAREMVADADKKEKQP